MPLLRIYLCCSCLMISHTHSCIPILNKIIASEEQLKDSDKLMNNNALPVRTCTVYVSISSNTRGVQIKRINIADLLTFLNTIFYLSSSASFSESSVVVVSGIVCTLKTKIVFIVRASWVEHVQLFYVLYVRFLIIIAIIFV